MTDINRASSAEPRTSTADGESIAEVDPKRGALHRGRRPMRVGRVSVLALAAASALAMGACSSSSGGSGKTSDGLQKVTIGNASVAAPLLPWVVAHAKGFDKANGLSISVVTTPTNTQVATLQSGSINFLNLQSGLLLQERAQSVPIQAIAPVTKGLPIAMIVTNKFAKAHGITASTPVAEVVKKLAGSTGGLSAASTKADANLLLSGYGVSPSKVKEATFQTPAAAQASFKKNQIDWFVTGTPVPQQLAASGLGIVVATAQNATPWSVKAYQIVLAAKSAQVKSNPKVAKEMVATLAQAQSFIAAHESDALAIFDKSQPGFSQSELQAVYQSSQWGFSTTMTDADWQAALKVAIDEGHATSSTKVVEGTDWVNVGQASK